MTTAAQADPVTNFRSWLDANGYATNTSTNLWYGTNGVNGPLLTVNGDSWITPPEQFQTPQISAFVDPGDQNGGAGPATFPGSFFHPGPSTPVVLAYAPQVAIPLSVVEVHAELILNGLSGNGVTIDVYTTIASNTVNHGSYDLTGSTDLVALFPVGNLTLNPGDTMHVAIGNRGSYFFDHVNVDVTLTVPEPASAVLLMLPLGLSVMRRR
ncbi:MAG: hypothetical protein RLN76_03860 [Phycisphaeraceae bacterium]